MKWLRNLFYKSEEVVREEWKTEKSILQFLKSNLDKNGLLMDSGHNLPDEDPFDDQNEKIRYAPGMLDSIFGTEHSESATSTVVELTKLLKLVSLNGDEASRLSFYKAVTERDSAISIIDEFLDNVANSAIIVEPYLLTFIKELAFQTSHRNSVKFGIAMLGRCRVTSVMEDIIVLGLHDEFTAFAAVAIANSVDNPAGILWDLAKKVNGWGRIRVVDLLVKFELPDEIKEWLVLEGYKNHIMYEYLAYPCAIHGELHEKLGLVSISHVLFKSAGDIIDALINGGPAEDMRCYEFAAVAVENYLRHAKEHASDIADYNLLTKIKDFLLELQEDIGEHKDNGWSDDIISNCLIDVDALLSKCDWNKLTLAALNSKDNSMFWNGKEAAQRLGIDIWDIVWNRLIQSPTDSVCWYDVAQRTTQEHVQQVVDFAIANLPLNDLATGPKDSLGIGSKYHLYQSLENVTGILENYPGKGERIILTALDSPVTRNRNIALKTLEKWGRAH